MGKQSHPREKVRTNLDAYIERLHAIAMSDNGIAGMDALKTLLKIADIGSIEQPAQPPIKVKKADPSKRNILNMNEAV